MRQLTAEELSEPDVTLRIHRDRFDLDVSIEMVEALRTYAESRFYKRSKSCETRN